MASSATSFPMDAAMARVLEAARSADAAVGESARAAQRELEEARAAEKSIAETAARRAARVRAAMADRTARRLAEIEALEREALEHAQPDESERRQLGRALAALAEELTGDGP